MSTPSDAKPLTMTNTKYNDKKGPDKGKDMVRITAVRSVALVCKILPTLVGNVLAMQK